MPLHHQGQSSIQVWAGLDWVLTFRLRAWPIPNHPLASVKYQKSWQRFFLESYTLPHNILCTGYSASPKGQWMIWWSCKDWGFGCHESWTCAWLECSLSWMLFCPPSPGRGCTGGKCCSGESPHAAWSCSGRQRPCHSFCTDTLTVSHLGFFRSIPQSRRPGFYLESKLWK